jgi:hypothetical protein
MNFVLNKYKGPLTKSYKYKPPNIHRLISPNATANCHATPESKAPVPCSRNAKATGVQHSNLDSENRGKLTLSI